MNNVSSSSNRRKLQETKNGCKKRYMSEWLLCWLRALLVPVVITQATRCVLTSCHLSLCLRNSLQTSFFLPFPQVSSFFYPVGLCLLRRFFSASKRKEEVWLIFALKDKGNVLRVVFMLRGAMYMKVYVYAWRWTCI